MIQLGLAILCSSSLALIFRYSESHGHNRYAITAANYATATLVGFVLQWVQPNWNRPVGNGARPSATAGQATLGVDGIEAAVGSGGLPLLNGIQASPLLVPTLVIAVIGGILYVAGFILYQAEVRRHGAGIAGMYGKLGILVPVVISLVLWREVPAWTQYAGMAVALAAIVVSQIPNWQRATSGTTDSHETAPQRLAPGLLVLLLIMGMAEFVNKLFETYGDVKLRSLFLLALFATALVVSLGLLVRRRLIPTSREIALGMAVGVPNLFSSYFLIAALRELPASVAFPVFSSGSVALIAAGATVIYKDRLSRYGWSAIALTMVALVLINLPGR